MNTQGYQNEICEISSEVCSGFSGWILLSWTWNQTLFAGPKSQKILLAKRRCKKAFEAQHLEKIFSAVDPASKLP